MALQTIIRKNSGGKSTLEIFANKLLQKIINAPSQHAIERYIGVALRAMGDKKINGYIIQRFIDRVTIYLDNYIPLSNQQAMNSVIARERLQQFRQALAAPAKNKPHSSL